MVFFVPSLYLLFAKNRRERAAALAAVAAEPHHAQEYVRQQRDRAGQHRRPRHQAYVVVADVADLVRKHSLELLLVDTLEQSRRDGDDRLLG